MVSLCRGTAPCSGLIQSAPPTQLGTKFGHFNVHRLGLGKVPKLRSQCFSSRLLSTCFAAQVGGNHLELRFEGDSSEEPFWASLAKEAARALRSLLAFLVEQPGQLKYIEWPSFQSTLKTASLTLVLVAILIVALSSIDAGLCYLLALILRGTP